MIREEALDWWGEAKHNLRQARKNFDVEEYSVAAFLCHQAAEKALKALYIVVKSRLPPRGQDLVKLGKALDAEEVMDELRILNPPLRGGEVPQRGEHSAQRSVHEGDLREVPCSSPEGFRVGEEPWKPSLSSTRCGS
ncbi:MAG: HEPN domain-containing protein [Thermofilum sp.]